MGHILKVWRRHVCFERIILEMKSVLKDSEWDNRNMVRFKRQQNTF